MTRRLIQLAALAISFVTARAAAETNMALVPAGIFKPMFRSITDPREVPVAPFLLDKFPVTNEEYLDFVRANPNWRRSAVKRLFADESYLKNWASDLELGTNAAGKAPVTFVSWFAAKSYAQWKGKRLPTKAEWELAAAASPTRANAENDPAFAKLLLDWYATLSPTRLPKIGQRTPNYFGIHDLHGLVWEWVADFSAEMVTGDARGDSGLDRQLFCGSAAAESRDPSNYAAFMRYGFRSSLKADYCVNNLGFRCAQTAVDLEKPCCHKPLAADTPLPNKSLYQAASTWTNHANASLKLSSFRGKPQIFTMFFSNCEFACPLLVNDMKRIENLVSENVRANIGFVLISFDTERDTAAALAQFKQKHSLSGNWTLLRGADDDVHEIAALLGVKFRKDARGQFAHSNLITLVNADGEVVSQQIGLNQPGTELAKAAEVLVAK